MAPNPPDDSSALITRAIGEELRRARTNAGWSRPELVRRMACDMPVNTYACYEQGIRQCSIPRLVEICQALGVIAPELLSLAMQRAEIDLTTLRLAIDLNKILSDERQWCTPLRKWASHRLNTDIDGLGVARLDWPTIQDFAMLLGYDASELLRQFQPESTPRRNATRYR